MSDANFAQAAGSDDFSLPWSGQATSLGREIGAGDLTRQLSADAEERLKALALTVLTIVPCRGYAAIPAPPAPQQKLRPATAPTPGRPSKR